MSNLVPALREIASLLEPFARGGARGSLAWNGNKYVPSEPRDVDSGALVWESVLRTIAGMLESQEGPVSSRQIDHLRRTLFGGMGSLIDFSIDETLFGEEARVANEGLSRMTDLLFRELESLRSMPGRGAASEDPRRR